MAKDPAFLFYPNDWLGGTMYMSFEQKGCYLELLMLQFNCGKFTITQVEQVLNKCFSQWEHISNKFVTDGTFFWNKRLSEVMVKRGEFSESRRNNRLGKGKKTSVKQVLNISKSSEQLMENGNENEIENIILNKNGFFINEISKNILLNKSEIDNTKIFIEVQTKINLTDEDVGKYFEAFKIDNFDKKEWYNSHSDFISHFRNSLKINLKNGTHQQNNQAPAKHGTSNARVEALKKW
jgi:uncharacterized protein YdaU (DUF1376 family)